VHAQRCIEEELCCEFKRNRITEDSKISAKWALSECIGAQEEKNAKRSMRRHSVRWE
jgi:hypothetical protein